MVAVPKVNLFLIIFWNITLNISEKSKSANQKSKKIAKIDYIYYCYNNYINNIFKISL